MCAVWFWRWCVQGQRRVLHSQGGGEDQGQGSCFLLQPQVQEVALPLLHHQAKAKVRPLRSPSSSCSRCGHPRRWLQDHGAACCPSQSHVSLSLMLWCVLSTLGCLLNYVGELCLWTGCGLPFGGWMNFICMWLSMLGIFVFLNLSAMICFSVLKVQVLQWSHICCKYAAIHHFIKGSLLSNIPITEQKTTF